MGRRNDGTTGRRNDGKEESLSTADMSLPPLITGSCNDYAKPLDLGDMGSSDGSQESDSLSFEGSDPYPLPPMTAGTRARIQYQTHENKRIESRRRRRRQRNQNRLNALICQYNERNRAERSTQVSDTDLDHTKVLLTMLLYPVEDINFPEISKAVMNLADGGTRNKNLSVNEILTWKSNVYGDLSLTGYCPILQHRHLLKVEVLLQVSL